jgi:hypothetical protein
MKNNETKYQWSELAYKVDPELKSPVGNRLFYKDKKRNKYGSRKK